MVALVQKLDVRELLPVKPDGLNPMVAVVLAPPAVADVMERAAAAVRPHLAHETILGDEVHGAGDATPRDVVSLPPGRVALARRTADSDAAATIAPFVAKLLPDIAGSVDINAVVQWVLRESYVQGTDDLYYFAEKVRYFNAAKQAYRDMLAELREIQTQVQASLSGIPEEEQSGYDLAARPTGDATNAAPAAATPTPGVRTPEQEAMVQRVLRYDTDGTTSLEQTLLDGGEGYQAILDALPYMTAEEVLQLLHGIGGDDGEVDGDAVGRLREIISQLSEVQILGVDALKNRSSDWWDEDLEDTFDNVFDGRWPAIKANNGFPDDISKSEALRRLTAPPVTMPTDVAGMPIIDTGWATANQVTLDVTVDFLLSYYGGEPPDPTALYSALLNGNDAGAAARGMWLGIMDRLPAGDIAQLLNLLTGGTGAVPPELEAFLQALVDRIPPTVLQQVREEFEFAGEGMLGALVDARLTSQGLGIGGAGGLDLDPTDGSIDVPQFNPNSGSGEALFLPNGEKVTSLTQLDDLIEKLEADMNGLGDDAQLANVDLQNKLQQQQQVLQLASNISKIMHDATIAIIRNTSS